MTPEETVDSRPLLYLQDLPTGLKFTTASQQLDTAAIKAFAAQFDPQPFHLDEAAAQASLFQGLAASGWHTASITMRLLVTSGPRIAGGVIGMGGEVSWSLPVRPGDTLTVQGEVSEAKRSRSRPDRGVVTLLCETRNQDGKSVQRLLARLMVPARPQ